jgi:hypothetical protein
VLAPDRADRLNPNMQLPPNHGYWDRLAACADDGLVAYRPLVGDGVEEVGLLRIGRSVARNRTLVVPGIDPDEPDTHVSGFHTAKYWEARRRQLADSDASVTIVTNLAHRLHVQNCEWSNAVAPGGLLPVRLLMRHGTRLMNVNRMSFARFEEPKSLNPDAASLLHAVETVNPSLCVIYESAKIHAGNFWLANGDMPSLFAGLVRAASAKLPVARGLPETPGLVPYGDPTTAAVWAFYRDTGRTKVSADRAIIPPGAEHISWFLERYGVGCVDAESVMFRSHNVSLREDRTVAAALQFRNAHIEAWSHVFHALIPEYEDYANAYTPSPPHDRELPPADFAWAATAGIFYRLYATSRAERTVGSSRTDLMYQLERAMEDLVQFADYRRVGQRNATQLHVMTTALAVEDRFGVDLRCRPVSAVADMRHLAL